MAVHVQYLYTMASTETIHQAPSSYCQIPLFNKYSQCVCLCVYATLDSLINVRQSVKLVITVY
jgi:hypothetical protein